MHTPHVLGIDIGGTKTAWGLFSEQGALLESGRFPTPTDHDEFLGALERIIKAQPIEAVGIGLAGTLSADHEDVIVCPNIPALSHTQLARHLRDTCEVPVTLDNDARCALIGEVVSGSAKEFSSAVMLTLGTGVGGAVMQKKIVLPHPMDISHEIGHIVADPTDAFAPSTGRGTVESLLGGHNLEERFGVTLKEMARLVRINDLEAVAFWEQVSYYFLRSIQAIYSEYSCKNIIIGGIGSTDLKYYLQDNQTPCPVIPALLGEQAGIYGAAAIGLDLYHDESNEEWE